MAARPAQASAHHAGPVAGRSAIKQNARGLYAAVTAGDKG